jgi:hypothetical protein
MVQRPMSVARRRSGRACTETNPVDWAASAQLGRRCRFSPRSALAAAAAVRKASLQGPASGRSSNSSSSRAVSVEVAASCSRRAGRRPQPGDLYVQQCRAAPGQRVQELDHVDVVDQRVGRF